MRIAGNIICGGFAGFICGAALVSVLEFIGDLLKGERAVQCVTVGIAILSGIFIAFQLNHQNDGKEAK